MNKLTGGIKSKEAKKTAPVNKITINIDYEALVPFGKYKGKKLIWVKEHDNKYYSWMKKEGMIDKWSLVKSDKKIIVEKNKNVDFLTVNGEIWVGIREHELLQSKGLCKYLID